METAGCGGRIRLDVSVQLVTVAPEQLLVH